MTKDECKDCSYFEEDDGVGKCAFYDETAAEVKDCDWSNGNWGDEDYDDYDEDSDVDDGLTK